MARSLRALTRDIGPDEVLAAAQLAPVAVEPRHGWSNQTWLGEELVVRISSGRLEGSFAHERSVVDVVARAGLHVPEVLACGRVADIPGRRNEPGEWIVSTRLPGDTLAARWPHLDQDDRARVGHQLGEVMARLHAIDAGDVAPSWWLQAHRPLLLRNAYRPRVELGPILVEAARELPDADQPLLDAALALFAERVTLFTNDVEVLIHGDLHGHNLLVTNGRPTDISGLLDWEGARTGPADLELDMILRWITAADDFPERPGAPSVIKPGDCIELANHIADAYPRLFATPHLKQRLEVYDALWHLVQLLFDAYWQASDPSPRTEISPQWAWFRALLEGRSHLEQLAL